MPSVILRRNARLELRWLNAAGGSGFDHHMLQRLAASQYHWSNTRRVAVFTSRLRVSGALGALYLGAFEERVDAKLGRPKFDPHGHCIPALDGNAEAGLDTTDEH